MTASPQSLDPSRNPLAASTRTMVAFPRRLSRLAPVLAAFALLFGPSFPAPSHLVRAQTPSAESGPVPSSPPLESAPLASLLSKADPDSDAAWSTEAFSENAGGQLKKIAHAIEAHEFGPDLDKIAAADFACPSLRPPLSIVFERDPVTVRRSTGTPPTSPSHKRLSRAIAELVAPFAERAGESHAKIKVVRVDPAPGSATTQVYFEASRSGLQINAVWECAWTVASPSEPPLLAGITVTSHEEVAIRPAATPLFADCTEAVFAGVDAFADQLAYPADHWHGNLDVAFGIHQGNQGLAIGDADGDGLEDIYFCQPDGLPNRLFIRRPDGTLADRSRESGLDYLDISRSALFVDLDNDGDQDFVLAHRVSISIHENDGTGTFRRLVTVDTISQIRGLAAADIDNDGDLDLYACGYNPIEQLGPEDIFANPVPYHDAENGAPNFLLRNDGGFSFVDATRETGLSQNNTRFSFSAAFEDFDNDGDQDLYVANDFGRNNLYRNELVPSGTARFSDVAAEFGVEDVAAGMSVTWGDYDNDGRMDIYVSNMWSSAGNRISYQRQFKPGSDDETRELIQRHARGNTLFRNTGPDSPFEDASLDANVTMGRWAWGSLFVDMNNDGWEDIYVTNGFMTAPDTGDL